MRAAWLAVMLPQRLSASEKATTAVGSENILENSSEPTMRNLPRAGRSSRLAELLEQLQRNEERD
jgi:hypothetical protein